MAEYVEYGATATIPGPFRAAGAAEWSFLLEADAGRLQTLCARMFAGPTGGEVDVRPLGRHVVLEFGRIRRITSEVARFAAMGGSPEGQVCVWVPCARVRERGGRLVAEELVWVMPLICVDNPISLASGREMYGFPKTRGWIGLPAGDDGAGEISLDVFGMDFGPDAEPGRRRLLTVRRGAELAPPPRGEFSHLRDLAGHLLQLVRHDGGETIHGGLHLAETLLHDLVRGEVRQVFLKQVRDVADGSRAALQQVTELRYRLTRIHAVRLLHEHAVTVEPLSSHPLAAELGLASQTTRWGLRAEVDFELGAGAVLWEARLS